MRTSKTDQTARMRRLISVFLGRTCQTISTAASTGLCLRWDSVTQQNFKQINNKNKIIEII